MDPAVGELLRTQPADQEVEAILRLTDPAARIPGVRIVSRFGTIVTCRLPLDRVIETRERDEVASLKAARLLAPEIPAVFADSELRSRPSDIRRPSNLAYTGRGCVVGFLDWGFAFGNASLRRADGQTRLLALWDQRRNDPRSPNHYGYGTIHDAAHINAALSTTDPYRALGYHPAESDASHIGAHGSHVVDIAVGNGLGGGPMGLAPDAEIICVHLGTEALGANPLLTLGDSVRVAEGISFIQRSAAGRPFVVSASIGRHGGPHDGTTLLDLLEENLLEKNPNALCVHSAGNYASRNCHAAGNLKRGELRALRLLIDPNDRTPNEVEIWYDGGARLSICMELPDGKQSPWVHLGQRAEVRANGRKVCRVYHRERDPQNNANLIDLFIEPSPPAGEWRLTLRADEAPATGSIFHAWVERDDACGACQARFHPDDADSSVTTSTLANGTRTISVGAVNAHDPARAIAHFSSAGPTRDGRMKPDCVAPGVGVLAARSPWFGEPDTNALARRSGTSMAAPHVSGCAALMLEAGRGQFGDGELREIILSTVDSSGAGSEKNRYGHGYLNVERAVAAAERTARRRETPAARSFMQYESSESHTMPTQQDFSARVLDLVDQLVGETRNVNADDLLRVVLQQVVGLDSSTPARKVYRAMRGGSQLSDPAFRGGRLKVIAQPRDQVREPVLPGDIIMRRALGEGGLTHVAIAAGPELRRDELAAAGLVPEDDGGGPGWYVPVIEGGFSPHGIADHFARRVGDHSRRGGFDQIVLRVTPADLGEIGERLLRRDSDAEDMAEGSPFVAKALDYSWAQCQALRSAATASRNPNVVSAARIRAESGVSVDANPYVGITRGKLEAVIRAAYKSAQMPEVLLAIWAKEGSTEMVDGPRVVAQATTAENAKTLFRCDVYYEDLGADHFVVTTRQAGDDNRWDSSDSAAAGHETHFVAEVRKLVKGRVLSEDIVNAINAELIVSATAPFSVQPTIKFYALSLLLVDALFTQMRRNTFSQVPLVTVALNYLQWNMGTAKFRKFLASADAHRREPRFATRGQPIHLERWALHTRPRRNEYGEPRDKAVKFMHYVDSYRPLFESHLNLIKPGIEDLQLPYETSDVAGAAADLELGDKVPNQSETTAVGAITGTILKGTPAFDALETNENADIVFKNEDDKRMTKGLKAKLDSLATAVKTEWPERKLRVTEAWSDSSVHAAQSLHREGRAADLTADDKDQLKLGRLARLAVDSGFGWVFYEDDKHVHASVAKDA
jgi:hypothetical protein